MTLISDKELKRSVWEEARWKALGVTSSLMGTGVLIISVMGDKSWSTIAFSIALIGLGLSYYSKGQTENTDFKLKVINSKIDHIHDELMNVLDLLSLKGEIDDKKSRE